MKRGRRTCRSSGFTLPEVLISGTILVVGLGATMAAFGMSRRSAIMAQRQTQAMHRARGVMENLSAQSFGSSQLALGRHTLPDGHYDVSAVSGDTRTRQIDVRIRWSGTRPGRTNEFPLTTWMSETLRR